MYHTKKEIHISPHTKKHTKTPYFSSHGHLSYMKKIIFRNSMPIKDRKDQSQQGIQ